MYYHKADTTFARVSSVIPITSAKAWLTTNFLGELSSWKENFKLKLVSEGGKLRLTKNPY